MSPSLPAHELVHRCIGSITCADRDLGTVPRRHAEPYPDVMTDSDPGRRIRFSRAALAGLLALSAIIAVSGTALAADPRPASSPAPVLAPPRLSYLSDLATPGSYVGQFNYLQCVGAAVQTMRNIILDQSDHSASLQRLLWSRARLWSKYNGDGGADPYGWAAVLSNTSARLYQVYAGRSVADTLHAAARAMALSGRPVGVTVWRGTHAWVISGITATNDPAKTDNFTVLTVSVSDPLWTLLGHRPGVVAPSTWLTVAQFGAAFTPYHDPRRSPAIEGRYVAVLPVPTISELAVVSGRPILNFGTTGPAATPAPAALP